MTTTDTSAPRGLPGLANLGALGQARQQELTTDVDRALDASEAEIRNALESLTLAGDQVRLAAAGLPDRSLTQEQMRRYSATVAALAIAQRALKDGLDGRM